MPRPAPEGQHIATRRIGLCRRLRARCSASTRRIGLCRRLRARCSASPARRSRPHVALVDGCACDASRGRRVRLPALACAARAAAGRLCKAKGAARCSLSVAALGGAYLPCCVGLVAPTALEAHRGRERRAQRRLSDGCLEGRECGSALRAPHCAARQLSRATCTTQPAGQHAAGWGKC